MEDLDDFYIEPNYKHVRSLTCMEKDKFQKMKDDQHRLFLKISSLRVKLQEMIKDKESSDKLWDLYDSVCESQSIISDIINEK